MTGVHLDFETFSEAGYYFDGKRWRPVDGAQQGGLHAVDAAVYAEHPSTEVLVACFQFEGGAMSTWVPGMPPPTELLEHVRSGGLVFAYNSFFEYLIWNCVCVRLYGWPALALEQTRDAMAEARSFGLPGKLGDAAKALGDGEQKDTAGAALIQRFSRPRSPTKNNASLRNWLGDDPERAQQLYQYCAQDVRTEASVGTRVPPLSPFEQNAWHLDQWINATGVAVDRGAIEDCISIVEGVFERLQYELSYLTNGAVTTPNQTERIVGLFQAHGIWLPNLQAETVEWILGDPNHAVHAHPWARRVLEIRRDLAMASVKKLYALRRRICSDGRVRGLFAYYGAERTGRWAGRGPQPQNLPREGCVVVRCGACRLIQGAGAVCQVCGGALEPMKWNLDAALAVLESFRARDVDVAMRRWGDVLGAVSGSLRALFVAAQGHDLLASDYRAIEAVVLAALAGEEWRLEVFRTHGKIYETSASKITGVPFEEFLAYKQRTGEHHPLRQSIGKLAELSSGYQGSIGAWKNFGADKHLSDEQILASVKRWRQESPNIVNMWYGLERAAVRAIEYQGQVSAYRDIRYHYDGHVLRCVLPSGRALVYHRPRLEPDHTPWGTPTKRIRFWGWNSNPMKGALGWVEMETYGGNLTENVVQAVSRDILAHGMLNVARAGYRIVLHVHDEIVCEEPHGRGSVEALEALMGDLPSWAAGWPVIAHGGWRGREYRKE